VVHNLNDQDTILKDKKRNKLPEIPSEMIEEFDENYSEGILMLDLDQDKTNDFISSISSTYILPECIKIININFLDENNENIKEFLTKSVYHDIDELNINWQNLFKFVGDKLLKLDEYIEPL
jgi:hypothetical protein